MRFLSLATYPQNAPRHGGQLRLNAIHRTLAQAGWTVKQFAVCPNGVYGDAAAAEGIVEMSAEFAAELQRTGRRSDVATSDFMERSRYASETLDKLIVEFNPDVISLEQPWLWPALRRHFDKFSDRHKAVVIYSSQNVEAQLLEDEYLISNDIEKFRTELNFAIAMERSLAEEADGVIVVSKLDGEVFAKFNENVVVAPNGVWPPSAPGGMDYWGKVLQHNRHAIFVGSYHAPNGEGFRKCLLQPSLAFLAPDEKIVVAGNVANLVASLPEYRRNAGVNLARTVFAGQQDDGGLAALYHLSDVILLSITDGGGTNIKTAEALLSGKRIVATRTAMRGYDDYLDMPGLTIVDDIADYPAAVKTALAEKGEVTRTPEQRKRLEELLWSRSLAPMDAFLRVIAAKLGTQAIASGRRIDGERLALVIGAGWFLPTSDGAWSSHRAAMVNVPVANPGRYKVDMEFSGFPDPSGQQFMIVSSGPKILHSIIISDPDTVHQVSLDMDVEETEEVAPVLTISLNSSTLTAPSDVADSLDARPLGIRLIALTISKAS